MRCYVAAGKQPEGTGVAKRGTLVVFGLVAGTVLVARGGGGAAAEQLPQPVRAKGATEAVAIALDYLRGESGGALQAAAPSELVVSDVVTTGAHSSRPSTECSHHAAASGPWLRALSLIHI